MREGMTLVSLTPSSGHDRTHHCLFKLSGGSQPERFRPCTASAQTIDQFGCFPQGRHLESLPASPIDANEEIARFDAPSGVRQ